MFSRHIDIHKYFVHELVLAGFLKIMPLRMHKMVADALTKSLPSPAFVEHRQIMTGRAPFAARLLRCVSGKNLLALRGFNDFFAYLLFFSLPCLHIHSFFVGLPIVCLLKIPLLHMGESDKAPTNKICRISPLTWP